MSLSSTLSETFSQSIISINKLFTTFQVVSNFCFFLVFLHPRPYPIKKIPSVTLRDTCFKSILIGHSKKSTNQKCSKQALHKFTREIFFIGLSTNSASYFSSSSNLLSSFFSNNRLFIFRFFSKLERKTNWPTARLIGLTFSASTFLSFGCRFFAKNENLFSTISREYFFPFRDDRRR